MVEAAAVSRLRTNTAVRFFQALTLARNVRLQDRSKLIVKGLQTTEALHGATLTFTGFPPIPATRRASAQTQALRFGGMTEDAPCVYFIRKTLLPAGLTMTPRETTFTDAATVYRVESIDSEPHEPHVRLTCNLAHR